MSEEEPIRVLLVDDHEVVRMGLRALLERRPHLQVVGEAGSVAEAVEQAARTRPHVVVMDVRLPDGTGIEACREIRQMDPSVKVIMLTAFADDEAIVGAVMAGASGYVLKQTRSQGLIEAIERAARGESLLDPAVAGKVLEQLRRLARGEQDELASLSAQERRILELVAEGKTNREIAQELFLSEKTVKNYVSNILAKLNLHRRSQAAAFLARRRPFDLGRE
ncbi:MAG: response regulator transcription factor [Dehalococcoidia bacterium]|nr:response regulator transcription factor [Dehalococcoidia bacterium]MDW8009377.1 response regulator transcription factor [Chloroflexota bacterium]